MRTVLYMLYTINLFGTLITATWSVVTSTSTSRSRRLVNGFLSGLIWPLFWLAVAISDIASYFRHETGSPDGR